MDKMLIATFDTAPKALKGVVVLRDLHRRGGIKLYSTAVIAKDPAKSVSIKQASERDFKGSQIGLLFGILLGALGGLVGFALGV
jgi:uncharacterized membrane protein